MSALGPRLIAWVEAPLGGLPPEAQRLGRAQQLGAMLTAMLLVMWIPLLLGLGQIWPAVVIGASLVIPIWAAATLSRSGRTLLAGRIMMACLCGGLLYSIASLGGLGQSGAGWIVMIPMSAIFYLPYREAPYWTVAGGLGVVGIWVFDVLEMLPQSALSPMAGHLLDLFSLLSMLLTIAGGLWVRRRIWRRVNDQVRQTNQTLEEEIRVRKKAQEEAQEAALARSGFLAMISHEIRTPLNGVLGITEVLLDTPLDADQKELAETVRSSGRLLRTLLNDVLDYSKIDAGKVDLEDRVYSLPDAVAAVGETWRPVAQERGLSLQLELSPRVPAWVSGDAMRLQQILNNLVSNALKFTEKGEVILRVDQREGGLIFEVEDTGIGMSEESQRAVFEAFRQGDPSVSRRYGGTGLGLAISRSLAQAMGGALAVQSELGRGSCFSLALPLRSADPPSVVEEAPLRAVDLDQIRVLVAEDNAVNQVVVVRLLERLGVQVTVASDGQECLERWESAQPDLILMDCQMPGMDGYQATRALRARGVRTPIVALTANNMPGDSLRSLEAGMDGHLGKPIQPDELSACVRRWVVPAPQD